MTLTHHVHLSALVTVDKVLGSLREMGIQAEFKKTNPVEGRIDIDVPEDFTMNEALALGGLIHSFEVSALLQR